MSSPGSRFFAASALFGSILATPTLTDSQRKPSPTPVAKRREVRVLFLGNSLTAANDLPNMVQAMAASGGVKLTYKAITQGGFNLEDHWNDRQSLPTLKVEQWDYLVLQQGPSSLPESQADLKKWAKIWADESRKYGTKPFLYMVWPFQNQANGFKLVSQSYRNAANNCGSGILPAGEAWEMSLHQHPTIDLYLSDRLHPTLAGSYLAALVITHGIAGVPPGNAPTQTNLSNGRAFSLPEKVANELRSTASKVNTN
jgi:hypothetical protein